MRIGIPKEHKPHEKRVAATPDSVKELIKLGFEVLVEHQAGGLSSFHDKAYEAAGAAIGEQDEVWQSDIILKVNEPMENEVDKLKSGAILIGFLWPAVNQELVKRLAEKGVTALAMDCVPRISRAQSMDALSSMASIVGYRAVVEATHRFGRIFSGQITAAGKVPPAKILVIGAGVAGLAAIGTAGSLGAVVRAFDTRPEVKEQITSMGADFLEVELEEEAGVGDGYAKEMSQAFIDAEMALFMAQAKEVDIIISTASIPGKPAPKLITEEMVKAMKPGSVIVDLAAPAGGNCELTVPGDAIEVHGVTVLGYVDFPSRLPGQSSLLFANNLVNLLKLLCKNKDGQINLDFEDVIVRGVTVVKEGEITWPPPPVKVSAAPKPQVVKPVEEKPKKKPMPTGIKYGLWALVAIAFLWLASVAPADFLSHFSVFVLACIVGYHVVWSVTHALHTPLMSVTNAISGIILVGALLQISSDNPLVMGLAALATLVASINIFGGFVVTQRMLKMFRK
ncbi:Re/Si-specific NAD(P)(+) transhydrogenase subunit alpha [Aliiglaciecola sp. CAU 1673]|uniref:Re/Si-specific NAD(P)(+) transhydrogenase subunit alpha n=1 Tax=Aliiglaciecola sp. CAU 1673 TaxID=3032595 RepID=UPI0023DC8512|nr:Re/Si-specific NAD(P)(+) transhydrogenase subunit alpha [Aliiglaciecola sp. CAU 1673]MDF2177735.1 Re/Si-specific NAD(P)(+) transhydrogenase subunit alpha [Aliiglaciecola sp. CAU 1673]